MDIAMPDLNGIEATRQLAANDPGAKVIALSGRTTARDVKDMLEAGASGFVRKESAFKELTEALRTVMNDRVYLSPSVAELVMAQSGNGDDRRRTVLSGREREVLQLLAEGKSTKQVARHLSLSGKTIETHRRNLMEKLQLYSVAELTKYAIREEITSAEI
jgi:DNA-binding NarL/FixJ family response regulator